MPGFKPALRSRLTDAGVSAFWASIPQGTPLPYVRLQVISDRRPRYMGGFQPSRFTLVQADCFATDDATANNLAEAVIAAVARPAIVGGVQFGRSSVEGPRDLDEETVTGSIPRAVLDLSVWHGVAG